MATGREIREAIADAWKTERETYGRTYLDIMSMYAGYIFDGLELGAPKDALDQWVAEFDYAAMAYVDLSR